MPQGDPDGRGAVQRGSGTGTMPDGGSSSRDSGAARPCQRLLHGVRERWARWRERLNGASSLLFLLYFLNNFVLTVPSQASLGYLEKAGMTAAQRQNYYYFIFVPQSFKPLYALAADRLRLPVCRRGQRQAWLAATALGSAACYIAEAYLVRSVLLAFVVGFLHGVCLAWTEFMLSACLIDAAHRDMKNAGALQGAAGAARWAGSLSASLSTLLLYPCSHNGEEAWSTQQVYSLWAGCAFVTALFAFLLPSPPDPDPEEAALLPQSPASAPECGPDPEESAGPPLDCERGSAARRRISRGILQVGAVVVALEAVLVWISVQHFVQMGRPLSQKWIWWTGFAALCLAGSGGVANVLFSTEGLKSLQRKAWRFAPPALFLWAVNCIPSASVQYEMFQTSIFSMGSLTDPSPGLRKPCWSSYTAITADAARTAASFAYAPLANARDVRLVLICTTVVSALASLIQIPLTSLTRTDQSVELPWGWHVGLLPYALAAAAVTGFFGQLSFVPLQVIATECSPRKERVLAYAAFLSFLDAGDSVGSWITVPVVKGLGIENDDYYPGLRNLLWISNALSLALTLLVLAVRPARTRGDEAAGSGRGGGCGAESAGGDSPRQLPRAPGAADDGG
eukprot:TRINITY_DN50983_c0_g1_i1.p1 TRINITY_DN50983_c0_g1~~TRINITY_DN50983_c0_g1_i1.p1  ORF type:complete len:624 (+),score=189.69 TRINITY_DN50983_c0_g1_i1:59-1930(+)